MQSETSQEPALSPVSSEHVLADSLLRREVRVLMLESSTHTGAVVDETLNPHVAEVVHTTQPADVLDHLRRRPYHVVVAELQGSAQDNQKLELCRHLSVNRPDTSVVVVSDERSVDAAVAAMRAGAFDLVTRPIDRETLHQSVRRAASHALIERRAHRLEETSAPESSGSIIGHSKPVRALLDRVSRVADTDVTVLITGESGTGKELVAQTLHEQSERADGPFVALNCAAVPAELLEAELFGHAKGAFTDAKRARDGIFVRAEGGTLLLDEVGEMPLEMQVKLLRALQERRVRPVGGSSERAFDVRIVAATNRDLQAEVAAGRFREDLFYRLNVVPVHAPPLRERGNDILVLAQHFVRRWSEELGKPVKGFSADAAAWLLDHDWPGNVRELENVIQRAVALSRYDELVPADLGERAPRLRPVDAPRSASVTGHAQERASDLRATAPGPALALDSSSPEQLLPHLDAAKVDEVPSLHDIENAYIMRVLEACGGNKTRAAKLLGIGRRTLYRRLEDIEVRTRPRTRPVPSDPVAPAARRPLPGGAAPSALDVI